MALRRGFTAAFRAPLKSGAPPARFLNIHEADGKVLMQRFGVDVQRGHVLSSADDVPAACQALKETCKTSNFIVKAQVLAGGRGKGVFADGFKGGVKFSKDGQAAQEYAKAMLGNRISTAQTPPEGIEVQKVFVAECLDFNRELYVALLLDRASRGPVLIGSTEGGVEIEHVAKTNPDAILKVPLMTEKDASSPRGYRVVPRGGAAALTEFATKLGFEGETNTRAVTFFQNLCNMSADSDITQLEVNPLVETTDGRLAAVDAKLNFDDSAEYRQKEIFSWRDHAEEDPREVEASKWDLNYIGLDGEIGCLVNGAGLAMATMDIIKLKGLDPANFLDVGGTATTERVAAAFKIITSDPKVKGILVNIFGGIVNCAMIADGVISAAKTTGIKVPVVVRLSGTNADVGLEKLKASGLDLHPAEDMDTAATKIVKLVQEAK
eukprot:TRINITY_DN22733_c0_g1_i1.p1 TRINITY_DN22733_c0_g1~~TRINITY_DN22733_c0_g1_i1.p1  ORF type:complete len:437 (-),score=155.17 TRINITY_DN22733_c0_g1_i1:917-2227(-)